MILRRSYNLITNTATTVVDRSILSPAVLVLFRSVSASASPLLTNTSINTNNSRIINNNSIRYFSSTSTTATANNNSESLLRLQFLSIYREMLIYSKYMNNNNNNTNQLKFDIKQLYRTTVNELSTLTINTDRINFLIDFNRSQQSKLSFMRMNVPALYRRKLPNYTNINSNQTNNTDNNSTGTATYIINEYGEPVLQTTSESTASVRPILNNSQGITDEQIKRHYSLVDRMNFRGPKWAGKRH